MLKIAIFGPPGSGKGTQADLLARKYKWIHISMGELLRQEVKAGTEVGKQIETIVNAGELVPDEIPNELVLGKLKNYIKTNQGFILDGYPRSLAQAKVLAVVKLDLVLHINISDEEAIKRIAYRLTCECGAVYNQITNPPKKANVCDKCGRTLKRRDDENEETVKTRLQVYHREIDPLISFYQERGLLQRIDGEQTIPQVARSINKVIAKIKK